MLGGSKLAMVYHFLAGIARVQVVRELRRGAGVGWRLAVGFGCAEGGLVSLRGIVRQLILRSVSCRIVGLLVAWLRSGENGWRCEFVASTPQQPRFGC